MTDSVDETRMLLRLHLAEQRNNAQVKKEFSLYYQQGHQAVWRGDSVDSMPKFQKTARIAAWQKGFADGSAEKLTFDERKVVNKAGLKKIADIMRESLKLVPYEQQ